MKRTLLIIAAVVLSLGMFSSCRAECPQPEPEPEKPRALHYFYVQNDYHRDMQFGMDTYAPNNKQLPEEFTINEYRFVYLPVNEKTLVRVFWGSPGKEPLNRFYYSSVIDSYFSAYIKYPNSTSKSGDLDQQEYWEYERTGKMTAEYTMHLTEELINIIF